MTITKPEPKSTGFLGRLSAIRRSDSNQRLSESSELAERRAELRRLIIGGETEVAALVSGRSGWTSESKSSAFMPGIHRANRRIRDIDLRQTELGEELRVWRSELADVERALKAARAAADAAIQEVDSAQRNEPSDPQKRLRDLGQRLDAIPNQISALEIRRAKSEDLSEIRAIDAAIADLDRETISVRNSLPAAKTALFQAQQQADAEKSAAEDRRIANVVLAAEAAVRSVVAAALQVAAIMNAHPQDETLSISYRRERLNRIAPLFTIARLAPSVGSWINSETAAARKTLGS